MEGMYEECLTDGWDCFGGLAGQLSDCDTYASGWLHVCLGRWGNLLMVMLLVYWTSLVMEAWTIDGKRESQGSLGWFYQLEIPIMQFRISACYSRYPFCMLSHNAIAV